MNVLEQAAELLENGWCKADLYRDGKLCSLGAIKAVEQGITLDSFKSMTESERVAFEMTAYGKNTDDWGINTPAVIALSDEIAEQRGGGEDFNDRMDSRVARIYRFNDSTSKDTVLEMFKYAAKRLDDGS